MSDMNLSLEEINGYKEDTISILNKQIDMLNELDEILEKELQAQHSTAQHSKRWYLNAGKIAKL